MINYGALKINYGKDEVQISLEVDKKFFVCQDINR